MVDAQRERHIESAYVAGTPTSFRAFIDSLPANTAHTITVKAQRRSKSAKQLAWYWGAILPALSLKTGYTVEDMHAWCKYKFLNPPELKTLVIVDANGEVIEEAHIDGPETVSLLTTRQFADYCEDVRMFAADSLQVYIEDPNINWKRNKRKTENDLPAAKAA